MAVAVAMAVAIEGCPPPKGSLHIAAFVGVVVVVAVVVVIGIILAIVVSVLVVVVF